MNPLDIKLPPLPPLHIAPSVEPVDYPEVAQALMDYARAAIKADRQRRDKALQAENERLRKDAERYRWLREHDARGLWDFKGAYHDIAVLKRGADLDAALAAFDQAKGVKRG